jgi:acetyl esterase
VPVTAEGRALLDAIAASSPSTESMTPDEARAASEARRAAQVPVLAPVANLEDLTFDGPGGPLAVRVYRPTQDVTLPGVVFAHGGGWVICDLDSHDPLCRALSVAVGAVVVSVDYRRAPEAPYPAAVEDVAAALEWTAAHAADLGVDPGRLAVAGDSAGGNLAAAVALLARDAGGPSIAAQLLLYPVLDSSMDTASYAEYAEGHALTRAGMAWYWDQYVADPDRRTEPTAAPTHATSLSGLPPAIIVAAECDPLRDEAVAYAERIVREGGTAWHRVFPGAFHGFLSLPSGILPVADEAMAEAFARLREALGVAD